MKQVYLLHFISWQTWEQEIKIFESEDMCKETFDKWVEEHINDRWLDREDFNKVDWLELDYNELYDRNHCIVICWRPYDLN